MQYCRAIPYISPKSKKLYRNEPPLYKRTTTVLAKKKSNIEILKYEFDIQRYHHEPKPTFQPFVYGQNARASAESEKPEKRRTVKKFNEDVYNWQKKK